MGRTTPSWPSFRTLIQLVAETRGPRPAASDRRLLPLDALAAQRRPRVRTATGAQAAQKGLTTRSSATTTTASAAKASARASQAATALRCGVWPGSMWRAPMAAVPGAASAGVPSPVQQARRARTVYARVARYGAGSLRGGDLGGVLAAVVAGHSATGRPLGDLGGLAAGR